MSIGVALRVKRVGSFDVDGVGGKCNEKSRSASLLFLSESRNKTLALSLTRRTFEQSERESG